MIHIVQLVFIWSRIPVIGKIFDKVYNSDFI